MEITLPWDHCQVSESSSETFIQDMILQDMLDFTAYALKYKTVLIKSMHGWSLVSALENEIHFDCWYLGHRMVFRRPKANELSNELKQRKWCVRNWDDLIQRIIL